jgi:hypothetical protein
MDLLLQHVKLLMGTSIMYPGVQQINGTGLCA